MALDLYMLGLVVRDMARSLAFYRRLGLAIPPGSDEEPHVQVKMGSGLTFFLDADPKRWDPAFPAVQTAPRMVDGSSGYPAVLEFYLHSRVAVDAKYAELTSAGYRDLRAPYVAPIKMYLALVADPDGNAILLSGELDDAS
jgi:catechol 2,3-dioxygenase-like lactoylglutathione lyase family enzyme